MTTPGTESLKLWVILKISISLKADLNFCGTKTFAQLMSGCSQLLTKDSKRFFRLLVFVLVTTQQEGVNCKGKCCYP